MPDLVASGRHPGSHLEDGPSPLLAWPQGVRQGSSDHWPGIRENRVLVAGFLSCLKNLQCLVYGEHLDVEGLLIIAQVEAPSSMPVLGLIMIRARFSRCCCLLCHKSHPDSDSPPLTILSFARWKQHTSLFEEYSMEAHETDISRSRHTKHWWRTGTSSKVCLSCVKMKSNFINNRMQFMNISTGVVG